MTSEFFKDFSIFEATEELSYMSSVSGVDDGGNFNIRGFNGGATNLRNGLASNGLIDASTLDRVEIVKGPAAAIYGATAPGGAVMVSTKKPTMIPRQELRVSSGSYSLNQVVASSSGPLRFGQSKPKLFYRFDTQYYHRLFEVPGLSSLTRSANAALTYRPGSNTSISFNAGYLLKNNNSFGGLPYNYDNTTKRYTGGYAFDIVHKNILNPNDKKPRWNAVFEGNVEHRFNSVFSGRFAASASHRTLVNYQSYGGSRYDSRLRRITDGRTSISFAKDDFDYRNAAFDLTAVYPLAGTKQRTLMTIDYSNQNRRGFSTTSNAAFNALYPGLTTALKDVDTLASIVPYVPVTIAAKGSPFFNPLIYARENNVTASGVFVRQEATILKDKIILVGGYRHDYIRADLREPTNGRQRKLEDLNGSILLGITYRVTQNVSWYVSRNESFTPLSITTSANPAAAIPQTTRGEGYETGVKGEMLDGRLGFTTAIFDTKRKNEQVNEVDEATGVLFTKYTGTTKTRGFEIDANYRLTNGLQVLVSYTRNDAFAIDQGRDIDANNRRTKGSMRNSLTSAVRYQVLPALSLTLSVRYASKSQAFNATDNPGTPDPVTKLITTNDGARDVTVPAATIWTMGGSYSWKTQRFVRLGHSLTITAKNLTDRLYIVPGNNRTVGDRLGVYATYSLSH